MSNSHHNKIETMYFYLYFFDLPIFCLNLSQVLRWRFSFFLFFHIFLLCLSKYARILDTNCVLFLFYFSYLLHWFFLCVCLFTVLFLPEIEIFKRVCASSSKDWCNFSVLKSIPLEICVVCAWHLHVWSSLPARFATFWNPITTVNSVLLNFEMLLHARSLARSQYNAMLTIIHVCSSDY